MKDIATELGISIGTVSKVLRDHPDISQEMRERVRARIQQLNYRPNLTARALVTGRTHIDRAGVPDLVHPFFGEVAAGLSEGTAQEGLRPHHFVVRTRNQTWRTGPSTNCWRGAWTR